MKGDGIYSRYFSPSVGGPGVYTFEVTVTDNGNTAYSWQHEMKEPGLNLELCKFVHLLWLILINCTLLQKYLLKQDLLKSFNGYSMILKLSKICNISPYVQYVCTNDSKKFFQ